MQDQGEPPPGWLHPTLQHTARLPLPTVQRRPSPCARCSIPLLCFFTLRGGVGGNQGPWWPHPSCVGPRPPPIGDARGLPLRRCSQPLSASRGSVTRVPTSRFLEVHTAAFTLFRVSQSAVKSPRLVDSPASDPPHVPLPGTPVGGPPPPEGSGLSGGRSRPTGPLPRCTPRTHASRSPVCRTRTVGRWGSLPCPGNASRPCPGGSHGPPSTTEPAVSCVGRGAPRSSTPVWPHML